MASKNVVKFVKTHALRDYTWTAKGWYFYPEGSLDDPRSKVYICDSEMKNIFGVVPDFIKVYTKNPKEKGAITINKPVFNYIRYKGREIWLDMSINRAFDKLKVKKIWVKPLRAR